jgi:hypothetical protein
MTDQEIYELEDVSRALDEAYERLDNLRVSNNISDDQASEMTDALSDLHNAANFVDGLLMDCRSDK